jgi:HSP20 family protein
MKTSMTPHQSNRPNSLLTPFRALRDEFDDLFNRLSTDWEGGKWLSREFCPACDISESADAFQIRMDVPGAKPEDITVRVTGDSVQISGERKEEKEDKGKTWHRMERRCGSFSQTLRLPGAVNEDKVQAEFQDGILTITLPKTEATKVRTVKVKANGNKGS